MIYTKEQWLKDFRSYAEKISEPLLALPKTSEDQAKKISGKINSRITVYRNKKLSLIKKQVNFEQWDNERLLNEILCMTYASYIVMLEYRNKAWPYDYMAFSRRIGEFWEPFCKLAFMYPIKKIHMISPPDFKDVQQNIRKSAVEYIDSLKVSEDEKKELKGHYELLWSIIDSGSVNLALDLHFEQAGIHYNCDFKSGFHSNEKGNANRLLLVASIYRSLGEREKMLLFVRQKEDENNHYLQTLKNSPYWDVFCADDCYAVIKSFTGFDIRAWLDNNADWEHDISDELREHLQKNNLLKYLTW